MTSSEPATAKRIRLCAEAIGFECFAGEGTYVKPALYWAKTEKGHVGGDVRTPEKRTPAYVMNARHTKAPTKLAFQAWFAPGFVGARVIDPVGKPVELWTDFTYSPGEIKNLGYLPEYAARVADERDRKYNDGATVLVHRYALNSATDFYVWLDDLVQLFGVEYQKMASERKPRATDKQLIAGGADWNA